MTPENFLRSQFKAALAKNKKLAKQSNTFKRQMEEHCVTLWKQVYHRGDEAIRQGLDYAKLSMNKKRG